MKTIVVSVVLAGAVGAGAFALTRHLTARTDLPPCHESEWLEREFALTPAQLTAIEKVRADYEARCAEHCRAVEQAQRAVAAAPDEASKAEAGKNLERVRHRCAGATRAHLEEIARHMDPAHGRRFLQLVGSKLSSPTASSAAPPPPATPAPASAPAPAAP